MNLRYVDLKNFAAVAWRGGGGSIPHPRLYILILKTPIFYKYFNIVHTGKDNYPRPRICSQNMLSPYKISLSAQLCL